MNTRMKLRRRLVGTMRMVSGEALPTALDCIEYILRSAVKDGGLNSALPSIPTSRSEPLRSTYRLLRILEGQTVATAIDVMRELRREVATAIADRGGDADLVEGIRNGLDSSTEV